MSDHLREAKRLLENPNANAVAVAQARATIACAEALIEIAEQLREIPKM